MQIDLLVDTTVKKDLYAVHRLISILRHQLSQRLRQGQCYRTSNRIQLSDSVKDGVKMDVSCDTNSGGSERSRTLTDKGENLYDKKVTDELTRISKQRDSIEVTITLIEENQANASVQELINFLTRTKHCEVWNKEQVLNIHTTIS